MDERLEQLLRRQLADGFPDLRGAEAATTLPVSERLLNELLTGSIPDSAPVRELHVTPDADDRFVVRFRLSFASLIPRIAITLAIDRQPELPASPILALAIETTGVMAFAAPVLRMLNSLPEGIGVKDNRIHVDLRLIAERRGFAAYFDYLTELRVHTVPGAVVVTARGRIR